MSWANRYVGIPFVDRGRDMTGLDCWGLVRIVMREQAGIELPLLAAVPADDPRAISAAIVAETNSEWSEIDEPQELDVAVLWSVVGVRRLELHVGIVAGRRLLLHTEINTGSVCVPFSHPTVRDRISKVYRHRERTHSSFRAA